MKPRFFASRLAIVAVLLSSTAVPASAQTTSAIGVNAAIHNQVQIKNAADPALRPAVVREPVHIGDAVVSGQQSALQILLRDQTVFTVGANARVTLDRFVYDPNRNASDVTVSVAKGAFRFMSGPALHGQGRNAINTPVGSIGVRGTIVEGVVGADVRDLLQGIPGVPSFSGIPDNATFIVLIGPGAGTDGFDRVGAIDFNGRGITVQINRAGQGLLIWDGGQAPYGPFDIPDVVLARLLDDLGLGGGAGTGGPSDPGSLGLPSNPSGGPLTPGGSGDPGYEPPGFTPPVAGTSTQTPGGPLPPVTPGGPANRGGGATNGGGLTNGNGNQLPP